MKDVKPKYIPGVTKLAALLALVITIVMSEHLTLADSEIPNPSGPAVEVDVGKNARGAECETIKGRKFWKFTFPPKLELIDKFKAERVPFMTRKNYYSPEDQAECVEFITKARDYRTGKRKPTGGRAVTMEEWDILVEGIFAKCGC